MSNSKINKAQGLLYSWMSSYKKRSYNLIREACGFLNESLNLGLGDRPVWDLFFPMVFSGVIDHIGKDYYTLTKPVVLAFDNHAYLLNYNARPNSIAGLPIGYSEVDLDEVPEEIVTLRMNTISVLKSFPAVDKVVDSWQTSVLAEDLLNYHDYKNHVGVAEHNSGITRYFSIPDKNYLKEMPSRPENPDAYSIGIYYERALSGLGNGYYNRQSKMLYMRRFAMPMLLYRSLALDGMAIREFPSIKDDFYVFKNISHRVIKELNRILCKSIINE